jgi:hypothetical protein
MAGNDEYFCYICKIKTDCYVRQEEEDLERGC